MFVGCFWPIALWFTDAGIRFDQQDPESYSEPSSLRHPAFLHWHCAAHRATEETRWTLLPLDRSRYPETSYRSRYPARRQEASVRHPKAHQIQFGTPGQLIPLQPAPDAEVSKRETCSACEQTRSRRSPAKPGHLGRQTCKHTHQWKHASSSYGCGSWHRRILVLFPTILG